MTQRALLIGSQTGELQGVHADIDAIGQVLRARGFILDERINADASRDGIIEGYQRLIASHQPDDVAVIYYSGHGARALNTALPKSTEKQYLQFIVPTDCRAPDGSFRGIFSFELSNYLARLTDSGRNVAVILDCCHAAMMSRANETLRPRAWPRPWTEGVAERLAAIAPSLAARGPEGNPYAVRLVAANFDRSAFEGERADGTTGGIMTDALILALNEVGAEINRVNWQALGARVRELVMRRVPEQHPEVEGPVRRIVFALDEIGDAGGVTVFHDNGRPSLRAGRLLGAVEGAEYAVMPVGVTNYLPEQRVAIARVTAVEGAVSRVTLRPAEAPVVDGALAFPTRVPFQKRGVIAKGADAREVIEGNDFVYATDHPGEAIATLCSADATLSLLDPVGATLIESVGDDDAGRKRVRDVLEGLARCDALRLLPDGGLPGALHLAWGRVENGTRIPMPYGDTMHVGERLYIDLRNETAGPVHMALFDLGISGDISLLTASIPTGIPLAPGAQYTLGLRDGVLTGLPAGWKSGVPKDGPRRESFVAIAAEAETNFRALEWRTRGWEQACGGSTPLEALLWQIGAAGSRDFVDDVPRDGRYLVRRVELQLSPTPRPQPENNPTGSAS